MTELDEKGEQEKWTPGPWVAQEEKSTTWRVFSADFGRVVTLHDPIDSLPEMLAANAHLIAAAPTLYHVLEHLVFIQELTANAFRSGCSSLPDSTEAERTFDRQLFRALKEGRDALTLARQGSSHV